MTVPFEVVECNSDVFNFKENKLRIFKIAYGVSLVKEISQNVLRLFFQQNAKTHYILFPVAVTGYGFGWAQELC